MAIGNLFVRLGLKSSAYTAGMQKASKSTRALQKKTQSLGTSMQKLKQHWFAVTAASAGFILFSKKVIQNFARWESALVDMGKVTAESLDSIRTKIMDLPPVLGSATELVQGYYQVISAGVTKPLAAMELLTVAAKASKAAHLEQSETIKALTKMMAGYEGEIKTVTEAADLLFAIEKEGQTTFAELVPIIGDMSKVSKELGISSNEMGAALALITQTSGSTAEAATKYKATLIGLYKPNETMIKLLKDLGFASVQLMIKQLGLSDSLKMITERAKQTDIPLGKLFRSSEGLIGLSALGAKNFDIFGNKIEEVSKKAGLAAKAFDDYIETSVAGWDELINTLDKLSIKIVEVFSDDMKGAMKEATKSVEDFTSLTVVAFEALKVVLLDTPLAVLYGWSLILNPWIKMVSTAVDVVKAKFAEIDPAALGLIRVKRPEGGWPGEKKGEKKGEKPPITPGIGETGKEAEARWEAIQETMNAEYQLRVDFDKSMKALDVNLAEAKVEAALEAKAARWEAIQESMASEYQLRIEFDEAMTALDVKVADEAIKTAKKAAATIEKLKKKSQSQIFNDTLYFLAEMGKASDTALKIYKGVAIAETVISTIRAAQNAYAYASQWGGWKAGVVAAAIAAAAGYARVHQIRNATPNMVPTTIGTGGGAVGTYETQSPTAPFGEGDEERGGLTIIVEGDFIGDDAFIDRLADRINEGVENRNVRMVATETL